MAKLDSLIVDLQMNTAQLRKGLDEAKGMFEEFGKKLEDIKKMGEVALELEAVKLAMEGVAKAAEFMKQGMEDAAALGNGPARELLETYEHIGLAARQLGANLMSNLAPAFNALIEYFAGGVDWGKFMIGVAAGLAEAFRAMLQPMVAVAGAIKGLVEGGNFESAMNGAATAVAKLAEHGKSFAGSLLTAAEQARVIAGLRLVQANKENARTEGLMTDQFANLTGDRRLDRSAGAMKQFTDFDDALDTWAIRMQLAAQYTEKAADADSYGSKISAEKFRIEAEGYTKSAETAMLAAEGFRTFKEKLIKDTQEINNIRFTLGEKLTGTSVSAGIRTQQYNETYNPTKGFKDFGDALAKQTQALDNQAGLMAAAEIIQKQYGAAAQGTVLALKEQADAEGRSAEAAKAAADAFFAVKDQIRTQLMSALANAGDMMLKNLGNLGTTINDVIKGAQQGGIWGALAALIADLLALMPGWKAIQNIAQGQLLQFVQQLSSGLSGIINVLHTLMGAIGTITSGVLSTLTPILVIIGNVLKNLAPILEIIGLAFQTLSPTLSMLGDIIGTVLTPIFRILAPILDVVTLSFLGVKLALEYVRLGFATFIGWIDNQFGSNNDQGIADAQQAVNDTIVQMAQIQGDLKTGDLFKGNGFAGPSALADASANASEQLGATANSANQAATAMNKMTAQLTNVPAGIKIALDRFNATTATGAAVTASGGMSAAGTMHIQNVVVQANDIVHLYKQLKKHHERARAQSGGGPPTGR